MIHFNIREIDAPTAVFTLLLLTLAAIITVEDIRFGKIKNKWIVNGIIAGCVIHGFIIIFYNILPGDVSVDLSYIRDVVVNTAFAFCCGYLMWKIGVWSAGDSKLFLLFSFLLPLNYYKYSYIDYFPAFNLLINIFAVSFLAVLVKIVLSIRDRFAAGEAKLLFNPSSFYKRAAETASNAAKKWPVFIIMFVLFNAVFMAARFLQSKVTGGNLNFLINLGSFVFMLTAMGWISKKTSDFVEKYPVVKKLILMMLVVVSVSIISLAPTLGGRLVSSSKVIISFMVIVSAILKILDFYINLSDVKTITINELQPGMVLSTETIKALPKGAYQVQVAVIPDSNTRAPAARVLIPAGWTSQGAMQWTNAPPGCA
ncbi:MAG TPA: hypothetical protein PLQ76_03375, partial [bacterium]|nr:hypothetical protein [bacterium]